MKSRTVLNSLIFGAALMFGKPAVSAVSLDSASTLAYKWMVSTKTTSGLYLSQIKGDPCYTYDQAVTVVAFLIKGDSTRARLLLEELQKLQRTDGGWYEAY